MQLRSMIMCVVSILLPCLIITGCSDTSQPFSPYSAVIIEGRLAAYDAMAKTGASSISCALVNESGIMWAEAFGDADRDAGLKATTTTLYAACSVSKMIATVAAMILVDRGQVDLDRPVTAYIGNFSMPKDSRYRNITVRMLLNHSSGLSGNDMRGAVTVAPFPGYAAQMMDGFKYQRLKHNPGEWSAYNNDGFTMIENLVKAVTGQDYPDFVRQNILDPLDMPLSRYQTGPLPDNSYARSYSGTVPLPLYFYNVYASGGLFTTPSELSHLAVMLINKGVYGSRRVLSERAIAAMAEDQRAGQFNPVPNEELRFGLGWDTMAEPGLAAVGISSWDKTGDMNGLFGTNIIVLPEEKLGVVVFGASNSFGSSDAVTICERILFRALIARGRLAKMPDKLPSTPLPVQAVSPAETGAYSGYYASGTDTYYVRFGTGDALSVDVFQGSWTPKYENLRLRSDGWYAADGDPVAAVRLLTSGGRSYFAVRRERGYGHYSVTKLSGEHIPGSSAFSGTWLARFGERWMPVNADPWSFLMANGDPSFKFNSINVYGSGTDMTDYVLGNSILRNMATPTDTRLDGMIMRLPDSGTNLQDAGIEIWSGQDWLRVGSTLYRPLSGLAPLPSGTTAITIGSDGFTEWRRLPSSGTLSISGAGYWFLYDANFTELAHGTGSGTPSFSGSGAKYLALFGAGGTTISLTL